MREVDTEAPVVWPAWCYSGSGGGGVGDQNSMSGGGRTRAPRRRAGAPLNGGPAPATENNNNLTNTVKSERLSPHHTPERSSSRSGSVTPSTCSFPGTPPQAGGDRGPSPAHPPPHLAPHPPPQLARNYSDFMRSLAAKYNNTQNNDFLSSCRPMVSVPSNVPNGVPVKSEPVLAPPTPDTRPLAGLFASYSYAHGGPKSLPAFPSIIDMSSTKTLVAIARMANASKESTNIHKERRLKRSQEHAPHPLDLSSGGGSPPSKVARPSPSPPAVPCCSADPELPSWNVDDVCKFVESIDICAEYAPMFRDQRIDGSGLPLLTEEHLMGGHLRMKLGPALKLRAMLSAKLGGCSRCTPNTTSHGSQRASSDTSEPGHSPTSDMCKIGTPNHLKCKMETQTGQNFSI